jgi:hypothetical protein
MLDAPLNLTILDVERRRQIDRRQHSWRTLVYCGITSRGRRRHARRNDHNYYLDHYEPKLVAVGLLVLVLSCLDALLTLTLLNRGAYEANYFMAHLLQMSVQHFVIAKVAITATGILFLLMHAHFRILRIANGKLILHWLCGIYGVLIGWEILLLGVLR